MVHTDLAPRWQQFHIALAMQQPSSAVSTPLWCIRAIKGYSHSFRITCDMNAVSLLESREQRYIKAINNNNNKVYGQRKNCFVGVLLLLFFFFMCTISLYCMPTLAFLWVSYLSYRPVCQLACLPSVVSCFCRSLIFLSLSQIFAVLFIHLSFFLLLPTYFPSVKWFALTSKHNPNTLH